MRRQQSPTAWMLKNYMNRIHMQSFTELAAETGIEYRNLMNRINNPAMFRVYEIRSLVEVLGLNDDDLNCLVRGGEYVTTEKITNFSRISNDPDRAEPTRQPAYT